MQIKTFTAGSMKDILSQIKSELGSDAVILSKREIADTSFGLAAKPVIEVTAAVDFSEGTYTSQGKAAGTFASLKTGAPAPAHESVSNDIIELKEMMKELMAHAGMKTHEGNPLRKKLITRGIRQNLADAVLTKLSAHSRGMGIKELFTKLVRTDKPAHSRIWTFVGTTGVGKTTTIAKIAARCVMEEHKKAGLITLDTYRIGAVDQGRTYAKILNIPFQSVTTVSEFRTALSRLDGMDLILVDTVGRSPLCGEHIAQMKEYLDGISPCTFLLMPVATRDAEMDTVTKTFSELHIDRMIFTKADEAMSFGSVVSHNLTYRTPISFITTGQRVPEDIEAACANRIIERCLGDIL